MSTSSKEHLDAEPGLRLAAERVVSEALGRVVDFSSMVCLTEPDRRSAVYRCMLTQGSSKIVKKLPGYFPASTSNGEAVPREIKKFFNDWVGAEFLSTLLAESPISPRFYGGDMQMGFFVLEDLGEPHGLVEPLLHGEAAIAEAALMRFGACLGRLHALTAGKAGAFDVLYATRLPGARQIAFELDEMDLRINRVKTQLEELGVKINSALEGEVGAMRVAITRPGPFLAYIHSDSCPDNVFDLEDGFRLIDFETGHFSHALLDAIYPRMIWPSCWCANRLPGALVTRMEGRYRAELATSIPQAENDAIWETELLHACSMAIFNTLDGHLEVGLKQDHEWGIASIRQRVLARLETFIETAEAFHRLPAMRGMADEVLTILRKRWPDTPELPLYPAFQ